MYVLSRWFNIFKNINCDSEDTFNDIDKFLVKREETKISLKRYFRYSF